MNLSQNLLNEAYQVIQSNGIYTTGKLLKKRAELLVIIGESEIQKQEERGLVVNQVKSSNE